MAEDQGAPAVDVLAGAYGALAAFVEGTGEQDRWLASGCTGWSVQDLVFHCLQDAQRGLVALHTPTPAPPDVDSVTYWQGWQADTSAASSGRRFTRVVSSMFLEFDALQDLYLTTNAALRHAALLADPGQPVRTQGHVLVTGDLLRTLAVEATVHHLDLLVAAPHRSPPAPLALAQVRRTLDGLLGFPVPLGWSDADYARKATGRSMLTPGEGQALGDAAARFPLFA